MKHLRTVAKQNDLLYIPTPANNKRKYRSISLPHIKVGNRLPWPLHVVETRLDRSSNK